LVSKCGKLENKNYVGYFTDKSKVCQALKYGKNFSSTHWLVNLGNFFRQNLQTVVIGRFVEQVMSWKNSFNTRDCEHKEKLLFTILFLIVIISSP
jgi:hypothetical protein